MKCTQQTISEFDLRKDIRRRILREFPDMGLQEQYGYVDAAMEQIRSEDDKDPYHGLILHGIQIVKEKVEKDNC